MFWKRKQANSDVESVELGDGNAEYLGAGTYEEYAKESEEERTWLQWLKNTLYKAHSDE